jgi:hypothetical protein
LSATASCIAGEVRSEGRTGYHGGTFLWEGWIVGAWGRLWFWVAVFLGVVGLASGAAAGPVDLVEADSQVFVRDNGAADVIYTLTFRENEGRRVIRKVGQFYEPVHFTRALIQGEELSGKVAMAPLGNGYYRVELPGATVAGRTYRLVLHYRSNHRFADPTSRDGKHLLAVWFNPVRWGLPVERSVIKLVLPLALPSQVKRHEDITPAMVTGLGVVTDPEVLHAQSHWAFVYTDYGGTRRLTLYAEKRNLPPEGIHRVRIYIPAAAMPGVAAGRNVEASGAARAERLIATGPLELLEQRVVLVTLARRRSDASPEGVELRSVFRFRETASRNFVARPPVTIHVGSRAAASPGRMRVWIDGRKVADEPAAPARLPLGRVTRKGQSIRVELAGFVPVRPARGVVVRDGEAWLPVAVTTFDGVRMPGLESAPVTVEVWTGLPAGPGDTPPVRVLAPSSGLWKHHVVAADATGACPAGWSSRRARRPAR